MTSDDELSFDERFINPYLDHKRLQDMGIGGELVTAYTGDVPGPGHEVLCSGCGRSGRINMAPPEGVTIVCARCLRELTAMAVAKESKHALCANCGCSHLAHQHNRRGTNCAFHESCKRYTQLTRWRKFWRMVSGS